MSQSVNNHTSESGPVNTGVQEQANTGLQEQAVLGGGVFGAPNQSFSHCRVF
ncbi:hypothetical protein [Neopusillimonas aromaticivorans]|uniref:hypothetical protein n=1 Tax=Neopusillimonas aromaticivorans TaxID=2979868 RepID=UPI00259966AB|nr:hypothetical protein [Neopusillimonas aromaticivorans]WJJ94147.1 hypothetical protein N7E01_03290 [Neopusillimonas aromaticivorans]